LYTGGGGVFNAGTATLTDCTLSGNSAAHSGGGVLNANYGTPNLTLTDCTLNGNSAPYGGGGLYGYGTTTVTDTIVAGNTDGVGDASDIGGNVSGSYNLVGTGGPGGLVNGESGNIVLTSLTNLGLAPLGDNGGPTQTMALLPGSAAIGAGVIADYPGTTTLITTDQRGEPLDSPNPDIGAFQTQGSTFISLKFSGISNPNITYGTSSVTISGTLKSGSQAPVGENVDVTLNGVEQSATIGSGGAFSTTFNAEGFTVSDSPYTITYSYTSDGTFASASTTRTLTVDAATLTITATPETKVYGTADPALAYTVTGFKFSDTAASALTGALARAQFGTSAGGQVGDYAIAQGTLAAESNYQIAFTGSTLTISPATLTVTANAQTKVYGTSDPALTDTLTGLVDTAVDGVTIDDTAATVLTGAPARASGETVAGSPYAISQGTLAAHSNYTIHFAGNSLSIARAMPAVTVNAPGGVFSGSPIAARATVKGASGTAAASLEGDTPMLTYYIGSGTSGTDLGSAAPSAVGTYTVVASFPGSADYAPIQSAPAPFVIAPVITRKTAAITLTSSASTSVFGQAVTFVAAVSSSAGTANGTVTFFDGTAPLATVALDGSGQAALSVARLALGSHAITATYNGAAGLPGTSSNVTTESVGQAATAIVVAPHAVLKGKKTLKAIELTAEIETVAPGAGVPTGQVTFEFITKRGKKTQVRTLGTATASGGAATIRFKPTTVLNKRVAVVYSGDHDFAASTMTTRKLTKTGIATLPSSRGMTGQG
jgi:hypothetical protein